MHGIGGRTIEDARNRLTYSEFLTWVAFRQKRGSLHPGTRMDHGFALLASMYANTHRSKNAPAKRIYDFMPYMEEQAVSLDQAMEQWS